MMLNIFIGFMTAIAIGGAIWGWWIDRGGGS